MEAYHVSQFVMVLGQLLKNNILITLKQLKEKFLDKGFSLYEFQILVPQPMIFDPDCVVLSGSMAQFVDTKKMEEYVNNDIVTSPTSIRLATTGNYSGMIGAALLALANISR